MDYFIWTEAIGCGEILPPFLDSYAKHHSTPIHVIGYKRDLEFLPDSKLFIPFEIGEDAKYQAGKLTARGAKLATSQRLVSSAYDSGHSGTALVWALLIAERPEKIMLHLDADTVFLGNVVEPVLAIAQKGYGVIGTRRCYRNSKANKSGWQRIATHFMADTVNTHLFAFRRDLLTEEIEDLRELIRGAHPNRILGVLFPVIDFFDRVTFRLKRRAGVFYLDSEDQGKHGHHSHSTPLESRMITFSAVGSGLAFSRNPGAKVPESYKDYALRSYSLYANNLLESGFDYPQLENPWVRGQLAKLDKKTWTLRDSD